MAFYENSAELNDRAHGAASKRQGLECREVYVFACVRFKERYMACVRLHSPTATSLALQKRLLDAFCKVID